MTETNDWPDTNKHEDADRVSPTVGGLAGLTVAFAMGLTSLATGEGFTAPVLLALSSILYLWSGNAYIAALPWTLFILARILFAVGVV